MLRYMRSLASIPIHDFIIYTDIHAMGRARISTTRSLDIAGGTLSQAVDLDGCDLEQGFVMSSSDASIGQLVRMKTGGGGVEVGCIKSDT